MALHTKHGPRREASQPPVIVIIESRHWFHGRPLREQWESVELVLGRIIVAFGIVLTPGILLAFRLDGSSLARLPLSLRIAGSVGTVLASIGFFMTIRILTRSLDHSEEPRPVRRALEDARARSPGAALAFGIFMLVTATACIGLTHLLTGAYLPHMPALPLRLISEFFVHAGGIAAATIPVIFGAASITQDEFVPGLLWRLRVPINIICSLLLTTLLHA